MSLITFSRTVQIKQKPSPLLNLKIIFGKFDITVLGGATLSQKINDSSTNFGLNTKTTAASKVFDGLAKRRGTSYGC